MGKANFGIVIENEVVEAGSRLKGIVFVDVDKEIPGSQMKLVFSGSEQTRVRYTKREGHGDNSRTVTRHAHGSRSLIQVAFPVDSSEMLQGKKIAPGQYKLPFELDLPDFLPGSMSQNHNSGYCRITYVIKAELKGSGTFWNYSCDREVNVRAAALDNEPVPFNRKPSTERVRLMCCLSRGSISFGAAATDTRINRGQSTRVSMSCRNHTRLQVKSVDAILTQTISWSAGSRHYDTTSRVLAKLDFGQFEGMHRVMSRDAVSKGASQKDLDDIFQEIQKGAHVKEIPVPMQALNSYQGSLISISHTLEIIVQTGACINNPTIRIPLQVGEPANGAPPSKPPVTASAVLPTGFTAESTTVANTVVAPTSGIMLGGPAVESEEDVLVAPVAIPYGAAQSARPSFDNLLQAMKDSISDCDIVESRGRDPQWKSIFESLSPTQYSLLLKEVDSDFDESRVAVALAKHIGEGFTCDYVVAALKVVSDWNRSTLCERLLSHCRDLSANQDKIKSELTDWERMVTNVAFENALH